MAHQQRAGSGIVRGGIILILALTTLNCSGPAAGPEPVDRGSVATVVDLGTGAVLGAAPESLRRERRQQQLMLDGHPKLSGDEVGEYLTGQAAMLEPLFSDTPVRMQRTNDTLRIVMPADSVFSDSATIRSVARQLLVGVADSMTDYERHLVEVAGHAGGHGSASANQRHSEARARAVGQVLAEQGVTDTRLLIVGYGEDRPSGQGDIPANRVELILVPVTDGD